MGCCPGSMNVKVREDVFDNQQIGTLQGVKIAPSNFVTKHEGVVQDYYDIGYELGSGGFGFVRLATHKKSRQQRAIKTLRKKSISNDMTRHAKFFAEVDILRSLDHPNIVKLYEFFEDQNYYYLVTEYLRGGELFDFIIKSKMLSEPIAAFFMKQLLSAISYCHNNNIVHRDLKPENLLLESNSPNSQIKVIDFGTGSLFNSKQRLTQKYGTSYYIAPEVLKKCYDEKCDVWSCGVILYILLSGKPPFYGREDTEIISRVKKGSFNFNGPEWDTISRQAKQLIVRMLEYNPARRISSHDALRDPWVNQSLPEWENQEQICSLTLDNLKQFRAGQKLQQAVFAFITSQLTNNAEKEQLTLAFRKLDTNNDGKLSREELLDAYKQTMSIKDAEEEVQRIMQSVDLDNSGFIDYTEFLTATMERDKLLSKSNLETAFEAFDKDGSGSITALELRQMIGGEDQIQDSVWNEIIQEVDQNGDGEIDIREFKEMMMKKLQLCIIYKNE